MPSIPYLLTPARPLLFGIFINDFDDSTPVLELQERVRMCKYADACTASESIPNGEFSNLQNVFDDLQNSATTNNMLLNPGKTKVCMYHKQHI